MLRLLCVVSVLVGGPLSADVREQLERFADGLDSLSGRFEQVTIERDSGEVVEESGGRLYFRAPDRFRWDYEEPFPQQMVADGEKLWHYDESLEQVTVREQPDAADSPLMVITRPALLERFYTVESGAPDDVLAFVPRDGESQFERGRLYFEAGRPVLLELHDSFGQVTRVRLSGLERNPSLPDGLFRFDPPDGVDVLEGY